MMFKCTHTKLNGQHNPHYIHIIVIMVTIENVHSGEMYAYSI